MKYIADLLDELIEIKENIQNNRLVKFFIVLSHSKYILTIIGFFILYFFYQLGYLFLYGFYFGGDGQNSIFNVIINPIPFNFKSIIGAGIFLLIYLLLLGMPFIIGIFYKFNMGLFIVIIAISSVTILSLQYMFLGNIIITQPRFPTTIVGTPIFICYMIYAIKNYQTYWKSTIIQVLYFLISIIIFNTFGYIELSYQNYAIEMLVLFFYAVIIVPQINNKITKCKLDRISILAKWIGVVLGMILVYRYTLEKQFVYFGYFILTIHTENIVYRIKSTMENRFNRNLQNNDKHTETKNIRYKNMSSIFAGIVIIIIMYPIIGSIIIIYGSFIGDVVMKNYSSNIISYEFNKDNKLSDEKKGIIVAQDGDTYYISQLPYRKLAIIKSKSIIVD